jgi:hypothetical protein
VWSPDLAPPRSQIVRVGVVGAEVGQDGAAADARARDISQSLWSETGLVIFGRAGEVAHLVEAEREEQAQPVVLDQERPGLCG